MKSLGLPMTFAGDRLAKARLSYESGGDGLTDLHSDLMEELYRKADADLVTRSGIGGFVFPMLLLLIGFTTGYRAEHPTLFQLASGAVGVSLVIRIALKSTLNSLAALPRYC